MTVTVAGVGTPTAPAAGAPQSAVAPTPANLANGHRVFVLAVNEPTGTTPTLSADGTGWTAIPSAAPGAVRVSMWWRDKDASWSTMPTVQVAGGASTTNALIVGSVALATDAQWVTPTSGDYTTGADTVSDTSFAATGAANLGATTGNYLLALCGTSGNTTATGQAMTAPGATLGTVLEHADLGTATGGAVGFKLFGAPVTAGTETGAPTVSCTLNGSNVGSAYFLRVRDTPATASGPTTAPVIRSVSTGTEAIGQNTVDVAAPAGLAVGDYLLAWDTGDADNTLTAPLPTLGSTANDSANNIPPAIVCGRVATAADAAAPSFTFTSSYATGGATIIMIAIQAGTFDPNTPPTVASFTRQARTTTPDQTAPSVTGVVNGLLLALFGADANGVTQTYPAAGPAGMTLVGSQDSPAHYAVCGMYSQVLTAAGATGAKTVAPTPASTQNGWVATAVLIAPAPAVLDTSRFFLVAA